jgi:hypothetical protein
MSGVDIPDINKKKMSPVHSYLFIYLFQAQYIHFRSGKTGLAYFFSSTERIFTKIVALKLAIGIFYLNGGGSYVTPQASPDMFKVYFFTFFSCQCPFNYTKLLLSSSRIFGLFDNAFFPSRTV